MDLPSTREIQLESLLRSKDAQIDKLNHELTHLRLSIEQQHSPSTPVTIPPQLLAVLEPYLAQADSPDKSSSSSVSTSVINRVKLLQEENDELYAILKGGQVAKLKEEVNGLTRVVQGLETALRESHDTIQTLTTELDKTYDTFYRQNKLKQPSQHSPRISNRQAPPTGPSGSNTTNGSSKAPPSAPRAFKKPRTSESQPPRSPSAHRKADGSPPTHTASMSRSANSSSGRVKMEVDDDNRYESHSHHADSDSRDLRHHDSHDRGRQHDRGRERDKDRDYHSGKDRERRESTPRRGGGGGGSNGNGSGAGNRTNSAHSSRRKDRGSAPSHSSYPKGDRTLAERMGL